MSALTADICNILGLVAQGDTKHDATNTPPHVRRRHGSLTPLMDPPREENPHNHVYLQCGDYDGGQHEEDEKYTPLGASWTAWSCHATRSYPSTLGPRQGNTWAS